MPPSAPSAPRILSLVTRNCTLRYGRFMFCRHSPVAGTGGRRALLCLSDVWRVEAEYSRRWDKIAGLNCASTTKGDLDSHTLGVHLFQDFRPAKKPRPFVGPWLGGGILDFDFKGPADINPDFIVIGNDTNISTVRQYYCWLDLPHRFETQSRLRIRVFLVFRPGRRVQYWGHRRHQPQL